MKTYNRLKPCPFCGGAAKEHDRFNANVITCRRCGAKVRQSAVGQGDAAEIWNRRSGPDAFISIQPSDEDIDKIAAMMPDGAGGMLVQWGYRQFARKVIAQCSWQGGGLASAIAHAISVLDADGDEWGMAQYLRTALAEANQKTTSKCDGNHGGPRCADAGCWNDDAQPASPAQTECRSPYCECEKGNCAHGYADRRGEAQHPAMPSQEWLDSLTHLMVDLCMDDDAAALIMTHAHRRIEGNPQNG